MRALPIPGRVAWCASFSQFRDRRCRLIALRKKWIFDPRLVFFQETDAVARALVANPMSCSNMPAGNAGSRILFNSRTAAITSARGVPTKHRAHGAPQHYPERPFPCADVREQPFSSQQSPLCPPTAMINPKRFPCRWTGRATVLFVARFESLMFVRVAYGNSGRDAPAELDDARENFVRALPERTAFDPW